MSSLRALTIGLHTYLVKVLKHHVQLALAIHHIQQPHYVLVIQLLEEGDLPKGRAGDTITLTAETHTLMFHFKTGH